MIFPGKMRIYSIPGQTLPVLRHRYVPRTEGRLGERKRMQGTDRKKTNICQWSVYCAAAY